MLAVILEHVPDRAHDLGRRQQQARVKMVCKNAALALHQAIERPSNPDAEPLHPASQADIAVGLDDQVQMVALDTELDDAQAKPAERVLQALFHDSEAALAAEVPDVLVHPQGGEDGCWFVERRPRAMRDQRPEARRLAAGPGAFSTPVGGKRQIELSLAHHD